MAQVRIGLLGAGIGGSRSPHMHRAAAKAAGLALRYDLIDSSLRALPEDPFALLSQLWAEGFTGLNVTYPFKQKILPALDCLSDAAARVGAVNTILLQNGRCIGHNTDHWGFLTNLRQGLPDAKRDRVLQLGAGGAGAAVAHALLDDGVETLWLYDLSQQAAGALAARLCATYGPDRARVAKEADVAARTVQGIVNCTPMGMAHHPGLPLPVQALAPRHWVADIVYVPRDTALLSAAKARGCAILPGAGMALYQAVRAFELFTGQAPRIDVMRAVFDPGDAA